jgi:hypothetical protein
MPIASGAGIQPSAAPACRQGNAVAARVRVKGELRQRRPERPQAAPPREALPVDRSAQHRGHCGVFFVGKFNVRHLNNMSATRGQSRSEKLVEGAAVA